MKSKISIVRCPTYDPALVFDAVKQTIDLAGGITSFVRPKSKVLVKPNLLVAQGPESAITTHPEVVRAVLRLLKDIGCAVVLGDGPSAWGNVDENVENVYEKTGMKQVAAEEGVELVSFDKRRWRGEFPLTTWLDECDHLVSIPKFKTHGLTTLTAAIKNLYGLVSGKYKFELHRKHYGINDFSRVLVDIYAQAKPALTVIDGIVAMEGDGPGTAGKARYTELLLAGSDCVSLDSALAVVMGLKPLDIPTTKEAAARGLGIADIANIEITGKKLEDVIAPDFKLPASSMQIKIPGPLLNLIKKLIRYYPCVDRKNCVRCSACIEVCPNKAMLMKNDGVFIDYARCISCFCCQEICPHSAIRTKKSLLAKILKF